MAEGDNNQNAQQSQPVNQGITSQTGANPAAFKKKRRRPRKKKPMGDGAVMPVQSGISAQVGQTPDQKKKRRRRPKKRNPNNPFVADNPASQVVAADSTISDVVQSEPSPSPQAVEPKDEFSLEPLANEEAAPVDSEPVTAEPTTVEPITVEPEIKIEPGFGVATEPEVAVTSEPEVIPEPEPEEFVEPELVVTPEPEVVAQPEPEPEMVVTPEPEVAVTPEPEPEVVVTPEPEAKSEPEGPEPDVVPVAAAATAGASVGWAQLKDAIKKDHIETEKKMKQPSPNLQEGEVIPAPSASSASSNPSNAQLDDDELEKKEVIQIIKRYVIGGCALIAIISGIFFFKLPQMAFNGITGLFQGSEVQEEVKTDDKNNNTNVQTELNEGLESTFIAGDNEGTSRDKFEEGVETALVTGEGSPTYEGAPDAIKTLYLMGLETIQPEYADRIGSYMDVLLKLQNAFATDIHQLLDGSNSREEALNLHLIELREAYQEALDTQRVVNEEKDRLKIQFNEATTQKDKLEKDFFAALDKLESSKSNDMLNAFIEVSKKQIELKAEYNSLNKVSKLFETALSNMNVRIKDIELNRDALIQGVKVVDIKGSDLKLIIQEAELL